MNDNVFTFPQKPGAKRVQPAPAPEMPVDRAEAHKETNVSILRHARNLVEDDKLDGIIVIGRQKGGPLFHTNHGLTRDSIAPEDLYAFIGVLDVLRSELIDVASTMAKELLEDGGISDPWSEGQIE